MGNRKYIVDREEKDFHRLRQVLCNLFPYIMVPPLPKRQEGKKIDQDFCERLQKLFDRFLVSLSKNEVLKSCSFLLSFLQMDKNDQWANEKLKFKELKFRNELSEVHSCTGEVNVQERKAHSKFCEEAHEFVAEYAQLSSEAISLSKEIHYKSQQLAQEVSKLSQCYMKLGKMHKKVKINSQTQLFKRLGVLFNQTSEYLD